MRVAIYHPWIYLKSGLERTVMEIKRRSRHDWTIYTSHFDAGGTYPELKEMGVVELGRVPVKRSYLPVLGASARIAMTKLDMELHQALVICCDGLGSLLTLRNSVKPVICLCFTPLRAVYDMEYRARHLERAGNFLPLALAAEAIYKRVDRLLWRRYDHVFCISRTVADRVVKGGLCGEADMEVAYPGIDSARIAMSPRTENFFFLPGRIMWTKNIELGIEAFMDFKSRCGGDFRLVIAGMVDEKSKPYFERLCRIAGGRGDIEFLRGPTDEEMDGLYRTCHSVLFTAFNEDLGLTPLEGMARGKPVIAVNRGGPIEVVEHGKTGLLVDCDTMAFSRAMESLVKDRTRAMEMGLNGPERAGLFTWERFVGRIDSYLDTME